MLLPKIVDVSPKGQILIPVDLRKFFGIRPGGKVIIYPRQEKEEITIKPLKEENVIKAAYGMLAAKDGRKWTKELIKERKRDLTREETKFNFK